MRSSALFNDNDFQRAVLRCCSHVTPELEFKWGFIQPNEQKFNFGPADAICNFTEKNNLSVYGHTLLWHKSIPQWALSQFKEPKGWRSVELYIGKMLERYSGVQYWDVVNEPINPGYRDDGLRPSPFLQAFDDYIPRALNYARQQSPEAKLMINEYGFEYDSKTEDYRRYLFLKLLESLKSRNVPLDGVGLQAHLDIHKGSVCQRKLSTFLNDIRDLGLFVFVTELDVVEADLTKSAPQRDLEVADEVKRYLDTVLQFNNVRGVSTWGLSDRYSWLQLDPSEIQRYITQGFWKMGSGPGLNRGLPLDSDLNPKPFYNIITGEIDKYNER